MTADNFNTRDLMIGWGGGLCIRAKQMAKNQQIDGRELSETDGKEAAAGKELTDGQLNKAAADGKPKKAQMASSQVHEKQATSRHFSSSEGATWLSAVFFCNHAHPPRD